MELVSFIASSAAEAAAQVRERLGPTAIVAEVRPLPPSRSWLGKRRPRFEVLAYTPPVTQPLLDATSDAPASPVTAAGQSPADASSETAGPPAMGVAPSAPRAGGGTWRVGALLESSGVLPSVAQRVVDELRRVHGDSAPEGIGEELRLARTVMASLWRQVPTRGEGGRGPHVLIGAAGVGKTTCLCKWLTQLVLVEGRPAGVWRLDTATANTAESLSVYCEVLGVPLERSWKPAEDDGETVRLVDIPGTEWRSPRGLERLRRDLERLGPCQVHLVVNGAYETPILLQQVRAFSQVGIVDLIVSHLDEEVRWGKLWNLVLGTNFSVRFASAGQNIPGDFFRATAETVLLRQFPA